MIKIIKADDRLKAVPKINIALFGPSGVGKSTVVRRLLQRVGDAVQQVRLSQTGFAIDEQRVVSSRGSLCHRQGRRMGEVV